MPPYDVIHEDPQPPPKAAPNRSRMAYGLIALLLAAGAGGWLYYASRPHPAKIVRADIVGQVTMNGTIVVPPQARTDIRPPFDAVVERVAASVGQHVKQGDLLVKLQVTNAEVYHEQTKQALKQAETAYANARQQLSAPVDAARRQVDAARAAARAAQPAPADPSVPVDPSAPPPAPTTTSTADLAAAEAALRQATADREAQLIAYRQAVDAARDAERAARAGERLGELRALISGTVLSLNAQPGQTVRASDKTPVATVVDLSAIQVHASVPTERASNVKQGTPVRLVIKELPGKEFSGSVSTVTTRVEERAAGLIKNQQIVAVVDFRNTDALVRPGMTPTAGALLGEAKNALAAPVEALDTDRSGRPILHVLRGGRWQDVAVETGLSDGRVVQIKSGVREGETIQVTPDILHAAPR